MAPDYDVQHWPLAEFMINSGETELRLYGNQLKTLLINREMGDYDLDGFMNHSAAEALVEDAREIMTNSAKLESHFKKLLPRKAPPAPIRKH